MIRSFKSKALAELWETGRTPRINAKMHERILRRLDRLDAAEMPGEMNIPGFDFHPLRGFKPTRYSVHVNGPWCITFEFEDGDVCRIDFEQYHWGETVMAHVAKRNPDRCPTHPGALLREDMIPATGKTKAEIARLLGLSRQHLYDILRERKPVSPAVAVRLGKLFGDGTGVWVRMQATYDTWHAEREEDVSGIPTLRPRAA
jgi:antitoxin HigA-1